MPSIDFIKTFGSPEKQKSPPRTMEELKERFGPLGQAAVERVEWEAVIRWLNNRPQAKLDPAKKDRERQAVVFYMDARAAQSGMPSSSGGPLDAPYLDFHRSRQSRIKKTATTLRDQWQASGRQCLDDAINYISWTMRTAMVPD